MRLLAFAPSTGVYLLYHDFGQRDGGPPSQGNEMAGRLFSINQLLLQATGVGNDVGSVADQSGATAAAPAAAFLPPAPSGREGGSSTILGAGMRRSAAASGGAGKGPRPRLAMRQWQLDREQWHLAEEAELDVVVALAVPCAWGTDAAAYLTKSLRDAFVHANRPQLLALASANAAAAAAVAAAAAAPPPPHAHTSGGGASQSLPCSSSDHPSLQPRPTSRPPAFQPAPAPALLPLQALKLLCRLAQEALDALWAGGLRPCWLYFVHVDSFMRARPRGSESLRNSEDTGGGYKQQGGGSGHERRSGGGSEGGSGGRGGRRKAGLLRSVMALLGSKEGKLGRGSQDGRDSRDGKAGASGGGSTGGDGAPARRKTETGAGEQGPVGQLQHLVLPAEEKEGGEDGGDAFQWNATAIAAAVNQVRPLPEQSAVPATTGGQGGTTGTPGDEVPGEEGPLAFPELEDVELELEIQFHSGSVGSRRFLGTGVRLGHVLAVVGQPVEASVGGVGVPAGSLSRVRHLLRPSLAPMSSLFHCLAEWVPQEEIAAHQLLLRLLE